jgi:hypothetical protein
MPGKSKSKIKLINPSPELETLLGKVFDNSRRDDKRSLPREDYKRNREDFIFHMTDWLIDLKELNQIYRHSDEADVERTTISLMGFLYHVIPHLKAAGRLLLDEIPDPFEEDMTAHEKKAGTTT